MLRQGHCKLLNCLLRGRASARCTSSTRRGWCRSRARSSSRTTRTRICSVSLMGPPLVTATKTILETCPDRADNKVVECSYDRDMAKFVFMRERIDKTNPNGRRVFERVSCSKRTRRSKVQRTDRSPGPPTLPSLAGYAEHRGRSERGLHPRLHWRRPHEETAALDKRNWNSTRIKPSAIAWNWVSFFW